jgi:hypothetical protein
MDAIQYALNEVRNHIPQPILHQAFIQPLANQGVFQRFQPTNGQHSVDYEIRDKVIEGRVNIDCNLIGGTQVTFDLSNTPRDEIDWYVRVYHVPYEQTEGRKIVSVQHLSYTNPHASVTHGYTADGSGNAFNAASRDMYNASAPMPIVATADCQLIGDNVVLVRDNVYQLSPHLSLTALVENEMGMANLNPMAYRAYGTLVLYATMAYIYNTLRIQLSQGALHAGQELGVIREIVDGYADANELYSEHFQTVWQKASFTNDRPRMQNFISDLIGGKR